MTRPTVEALIRRHGLQPLPVEGGLYRQTWRSPPPYADAIPAGTSIVALFVADRPDGCSTFHRLTRDEVWHAYDGDSFRLILLHPGGESEERLLGRGEGQQVQTVVTAGLWMGGHVADGGEWSLLGCTMAPGFTPECFEGADRDVLLRGWPDRAADIVRLTHQQRPGALPMDLDR